MGNKKAAKVLSQIEDIDPIYREQGKNAFDVENAFQLYSSFTGDVQRTAFALGVKPQVVIEMAQELKWDERLKSIFDLKKTGKPGDLEKALSRAINFVQAHRMRIVLERMITRLYEMPVDKLVEECTAISYDKEGNEIKRMLNTRALSDLCAAVEKIHQLTYVALVDTVTERARRQDNGDAEVSLGSIHAVISQAMADSKTSPRREEFSAKLAKAQEALAPPAPPK